MMYWQHLSTQEKIEAIKECWEPGMAASGIAAHFDGASRNAVIGVYYRYAAALADYPLRRPKSSKRSPHRNPKPKPALIFKKASPRNIGWGNVAKKTKRGPSRCEPTGDPHTVGRPISHLPAQRCRFAVTAHDAPADGHLFCGMPAENIYCEHHRGIVYQPRSALNERGIAA